MLTGQVKGVEARFSKFHCFATHFTSVSYSLELHKGESNSIYFLKALFKTNTEIDVSRSWLWRCLNYLVPKITTS